MRLLYNLTLALTQAFVFNRFNLTPTLTLSPVGVTESQHQVEVSIISAPGEESNGTHALDKCPIVDESIEDTNGLSSDGTTTRPTSAMTPGAGHRKRVYGADVVVVSKEVVTSMSDIE